MLDSYRIKDIRVFRTNRVVDTVDVWELDGTIIRYSKNGHDGYVFRTSARKGEVQSHELVLYSQISGTVRTAFEGGYFPVELAANL